MKYEAIDRWNNSGPYLEHWGIKKNHKYIIKVGEGPTARYLYTQEEVNAYKRGLSNTHNKKAWVHENVSGLKRTGREFMSTGLIGQKARKEVEVVNPHVSNKEKDPRYAINSAYKPKATAKTRLQSRIKNSVNRGQILINKWLKRRK